MDYKIILVRNKQKIKTFYSCRTHETAINKFNEYVKNNKVFYPKKIVNDKKIKSVKYELLLLKERTENDKNRMIKNDFGKIVEETVTDEKWVIIDRNNYQIEESFWVYGNSYKNERLTIKEIMKDILLKDIRKKYHTKQIIILQNKLIFQADEDFDIVFCKTKSEATRLHNTLMTTAKTTRMDKLMFMGHASDKMKYELYLKIQEKTGWTLKRIRRPSTCH